MDLIRPILQFFRDVYQLVFRSEDTPADNPITSNTDLELGQIMNMSDIIAKLIAVHARGTHLTSDQTFQTADKDDLFECAKKFWYYYNAGESFRTIINLLQAQKAGRPQGHDLISFECFNCPQCYPGRNEDFICLVSKNEQSGRRDYVAFGAKSVLLFQVLQWNGDWFRSYCKLFPRAILPRFSSAQSFEIFTFADVDLVKDLMSRGFDLHANYESACKAVMLRKNHDPMLDWLREHGPRDSSPK